MSEVPKPGVDYYTTDMGDVTETGGEIMYRLRQEELRRQHELDDTFDDSPSLNNYPDEINERSRDESA